MTIDTQAALLYSLSNTSWNAKVCFGAFIHFRLHTAAPAYIEVKAWITPWAWFVDPGMIEYDLEKRTKGVCNRADFMPEQHITHDKHGLKNLNASELCVNSARFIRNAIAHAAHCMVQWKLQLACKFLQGCELSTFQFFIIQIRFHSPSHEHWNLRLEKLSSPENPCYDCILWNHQYFNFSV